MDNLLRKVGIILSIGDIYDGGDYRFVDVVVESSIVVGGSSMLSPVVFRFVGNKIGMLSRVIDGDLVEVVFDVVGREVRREGKVSYFNTLEVFDIKVLDGEERGVEVEI